MYVYRPVRWVLLPFFLVYFRLSRIGMANVPREGAFILAANHRSFLDPFVLAAMTPRPLHYVAKSELFENRIAGWLLNALGGFPVRRGEGDTKAIETALAILARGEGVVIFPEGTRVRGDRLGRPRRGIGHIALDAGVPVVPAAVVGTEHVRRGVLVKPRKVRISVAKPQGFPQPDWASPRLAGAVLDRVWPQIVLQWNVLTGNEHQAPEIAPPPIAEQAAKPTAKPSEPPQLVAAQATRELAPADLAAPLAPLARLEALADRDSLELIRSAVRSTRMGDRARDGDGLIAARACVDGRTVFCFAQDPSFAGGSLGAAHAEGIAQLMQLSLRSRTPLVGFVESGGARLQEGLAALGGYGKIFKQQVTNSGVVPQISVVCGAAAGGAAYGPALGDFVIMTDDASTFLTGPSVVAKVTGEQVDAQSLGGPAVHERNGVCHLRAPGDVGAARLARDLLAFLPQHAGAAATFAPPEPPPGDTIEELVPTDLRKVYDVRAVIAELTDRGRMLEISPQWAPNLVCALARVEGRPVGVIANQPKHLAGVLDAESSQKGARFVRTCNAYGLPLVVLVDTPGFMPGSVEERGGVIRHGATLVHAFAEASMPSVTVVLRKAFGGAFIAMNCRALGADYAYAWPIAQLGVMGAEQAVGILHRREIAGAADAGAAQQSLAAAYADEHLGAVTAAAGGFVDEVIAPGETRARIASAFVALERATAVAT